MSLSQPEVGLALLGDMEDMEAMVTEALARELPRLRLAQLLSVDTGTRLVGMETMAAGEVTRTQKSGSRQIA